MYLVTAFTYVVGLSFLLSGGTNSLPYNGSGLFDFEPIVAPEIPKRCQALEKQLGEDWSAWKMLAEEISKLAENANTRTERHALIDKMVDVDFCDSMVKSNLDFEKKMAKIRSESERKLAEINAEFQAKFAEIWARG